MSKKLFGVLRGVKVVDLTRMLAGPFSTMMLADQGAEVIKVEGFDGDATRTTGPFTGDGADGELGGFFQSANRNKKSIVIDLKSPAGLEVVKSLIESADVVVENFRSGVMEKLGLSFDVLKVINPKIVYASISGFGDARNGKSPFVKWPAFDVVAQAMGGLIATTGADAQNPTRVGQSVGDIVPGMFAAFGIVSALRYAELSGEAQHVDVSMLDSILAICESSVYQYSYTKKVPGPAGNHHSLVAPLGLFEAKDGWIALAAPQDHSWKILCEYLDMAALMDDKRFGNALLRRTNIVQLAAEINKRTSLLSKVELLELFGGVIPVGSVNDMEDIFDSPHYAARNMLVSVDDPQTGKSQTIAGTPVKFSETPGGIQGRAPLLGEHTKEILLAAGLSEATLAELISKKVIG
jgi:crotonobetainyl-CoA:carnitine CoA-transferase CaiB-like acyl-CoA transferase